MSKNTAAAIKTTKTTRATIFGYSLCAVLRWMADNAWTVEDAVTALEVATGKPVSTVTVYCQFAKTGSTRGPVAPLTKAQANKLAASV